MARAKTFSLGEAYDGILADLVKNGRFGTETEVVRAGIRRRRSSGSPKQISPVPREIYIEWPENASLSSALHLLQVLYRPDRDPR